MPTLCCRQDGILSSQCFNSLAGSYVTRHLNCLDHSGWVASNHSKRWHIFGHDTTSPNRSSIANVYTRENYYISAKPTIRSDVDGLASFWASSAIPNTRVKRVRSAVEAAIGTDQGTCSDGDLTRVDPRRIGVDEDVGSESRYRITISLRPLTDKLQCSRSRL